MKEILAEIELINGEDMAMLRCNLIEEQQVRRAKVNVLVDTTTASTYINESIRRQLGLRIIETGKAHQKDGCVTKYKKVSFIEMKFADRRGVTNAIILDECDDVVLGFTGLAELNLIIDPVSQKLVQNPRPHRI